MILRNPFLASKGLDIYPLTSFTSEKNSRPPRKFAQFSLRQEALLSQQMKLADQTCQYLAIFAKRAEV